MHFKLNFVNPLKKQIRLGIYTGLCTDIDDRDFESLSLGLILIEFQFLIETDG